MLERRGDIEGAIAIYEDILIKNPKHRQSIKNLKSIYKDLPEDDPTQRCPEIDMAKK